MRDSTSVVRILLLVLAAGLLVWAGVATLESRKAPIGPAIDTWLPMPPVSMDAHELPVRQVVLKAMTIEQDTNGRREPFDTLAMRCGWGAQNEPAEQYAAFIGDWALSENPQAWRVKMIPQGSAMWVSVDTRALMPPPPPGAKEPPRRAPVVFVLPMDRVAAIRDAWSAPQIWEQATQVHGCTDGRPALFEACVHGKYVATQRACSEAGPQVDRLWATMRRDLPVPPKPVEAAQ